MDSYHLVGIAGAGMNPLAQILQAAGHEVSGSDRYADQGADLEVLAKLRRAGICMYPQDGSGVKPGMTAVVVSTAIEQDNPDLAAAARLAIPVAHRATVLAELAKSHSCIAIAGTSGKTTVTGMTGYLLEQLGADPTVVNGGSVINWIGDDRVGNVRAGAGPLWVVEVDESDRSFLAFHPDWAVITNISADHFDLAETARLFDQFRANVRCGIIDGGVPAPWSDLAVKLEGSKAAFEYRGVPFSLNVPGRHNAENALQAALMCERLGYDLKDISRALAGFRGIERRLQKVGSGRVAVYDDYAHNPAKISAALRTLRPIYPRLHCIWRPHGFGPLRQMRDDLAAMFAREMRSCDRLYLLPVYYAGGTAAQDVTSDMLAQQLRPSGLDIRTFADYAALEMAVAGDAAAGEAVVIMGARDPELPRCARRLATRLEV